MNQSPIWLPRAPRRRNRLKEWAVPLGAALLMAVFAAQMLSRIADERPRLATADVSGSDTDMDTDTSDTDAAAARTTTAAAFGLCPDGGGENCVVDGDTIRVGGRRIRVADIDAPETHHARCESEQERGNRATQRLQALVNEGPVEIVATDGPDTDRHGRQLRRLERNGTSLGDVLVNEGLARRWDGARHPWCA